jgi:hypothetical protein
LWPELEADHSPSSTAEVINFWNCTSTHPYLFIAWRLINYAQGQIYYYITPRGVAAFDVFTLPTDGVGIRSPQFVNDRMFVVEIYKYLQHFIKDDGNGATSQNDVV